MVLEYIGEPADYRRLLTLLGISSYGAPRRNIARLSRLGVEVVYRAANISILTESLRQGDPVIAFVDTGELSYWTETTNHAVVVVGIEGDNILYSTPDPNCIRSAFHLWRNGNGGSQTAAANRPGPPGCNRYANLC